MTIQDILNKDPLNNAELEKAKKNDQKLRNMAESLSEQGVKFDVVELDHEIKDSES